VALSARPTSFSAENAAQGSLSLNPSRKKKSAQHAALSIPRIRRSA